MTFLELYDLRLDIELASEDQTQLFTTARRKRAVNDGVQAFVRQTACTKRLGEIPLVDNAGLYAVPLAITDWYRSTGDVSVRMTSGSNVQYVQGPLDFPRREPAVLNHLYPGWLTATGRPASWYFQEDGGLYLGIYPKPDIPVGDTWVAILPYLAQPIEYTDDIHVPLVYNGIVIAEQYHQAFAHYAAAVLEPLRKNYAGATRQMDLFTGYVTEYLKEQTHLDGNQLTLAHDYYSPRTRVRDPRSWP